MTTIDQNNASTRFKKPAQRLLAYYFYIAGVLLAMLAAAVLVSAEAQTQEPKAADTTTKIRYSASDITRAFGFIDANNDGKMSREEASRFRNIAKHFDAADANLDGNLSIDEFSSALNRP